MDELPPKVRERLTQLSQRFRDGLPEVFSNLTDLRSRGADGDVDALRELRMRVHRIAEKRIDLRADRADRRGTVRGGLRGARPCR